MMRHVVLIKWARQLTPAEFANVLATVDRLAQEAGTVRAFAHGPDLGLRAMRYDYGLVADFDDAEGWQAYSAHPAHDDVRALIEPMKADTCVVQFNLDDGHVVG
jgi:hypothetical protein